MVEDLFWLAVAVSFDFLFIGTYLERLAGCFSSMCRFKFAVADFLKPSGQSLHKKEEALLGFTMVTFLGKLPSCRHAVMTKSVPKCDQTGRRSTITLLPVCHDSSAPEMLSLT